MVRKIFNTNYVVQYCAHYAIYIENLPSTYQKSPSRDRHCLLGRFSVAVEQSVVTSFVTLLCLVSFY